MDFNKLIKARYSVRAYKGDPVPPELLDQVIEAGIMAPTAANRQAFRIVVIGTADRKEDLNKVYKAPWLTDAPLVLAVIGLPGENWVRSDGRNYNDVDCAIVMDHLTLAAADLGLGTCWIGAFDASAARAFLGLPQEAEPIAFTPLGYAADEPRPKKRKTKAELVKHAKW